MSNPDIICPQPTRPLKRKASQLDPSSDRHRERIASKRQILFSPPPDSINQWLAELPPFSIRQSSRSDSFLVCNMNRRPESANKPRSAQSTARKSHSYQLPSPRSLQAAPASQTSMLRGSPSYPPALPSPYTPVSQQTTLSYTSSFNPREDAKKSKRIRSPAYRDELKNHSVYIDSWGMSMPANVHGFAQKIIEKERTSPSLTDQEVAYTREQLCTLDNADEEVTRTGFANTSLFPRTLDYKVGVNNYSLAVGANLPFDPAALPYTPGSRYLPIVTPIPDFHYGYPYQSFTKSQSRLPEVLQHPRLRPYAQPNSSTYWPFFAVEYKSQSRLGSTWVAENQNAGTGAHCVNSIETLLNYTKTTEQRQITDSLAFSCVADSHNAALWVHWREDGVDPRFVSSEIGYYHFHRPSDIRKFRSSVKNIIDYGLNERLLMIQNALSDILPQIPDWDAEDKAKKARRSSQIDDAFSSSSFN
ncbi:hypothetical protein MMC06_002463 [Schaereria dolodes]|nr:hypothetical protein [Schaereria dolodes]